jgi:hypothetical protein
MTARHIYPYALAQRYPVTGETLNMLVDLVARFRDGQPIGFMVRSTAASILEEVVQKAASEPLVPLAEVLEMIAADMQITPTAYAAKWAAVIEPVADRLRNGITPEDVRDATREELDNPAEVIDPDSGEQN